MLHILFIKNNALAHLVLRKVCRLSFKLNKLMTTKYKIWSGIVAGVGVFGLIGAAQAGPISVGDIITATGGDVTVTFNSFSAADTDNLSLYMPSTSGVLIVNQTTALGKTFDLGSFAAGAELEFALDNVTTGNTFYTGPGSRNGDGDVHAQVTNISSTQATVGFEDLFGSSSDWDYNDLDFTVNQVQGGPPPIPHVPDASATLPLLGMSLAGLATFARRFKK